MRSKQIQEFSSKKLSEICEIFSGGTPYTKNKEYWDGDIPWLSSGETRNNFIVDTKKRITSAGVKNSSTRLAKKNDVVVASAGQGNTRGQVSLCLIDTYVNQSVIVLRTNNEIILPKFLFYNLKSRYQELRQLSDSHSSRGSLPKNVLSIVNIMLPTLSQQEKVGKILYDLDSKIQNLKNQNKILEQTAHAIFKSWFVNFDGVTEFENSELGKIPKEWKVGKLEKFVNYLVGFAFKSREFYEGNDGIKLARGDNVKRQELVWGSKTRLWKNVTPNLEKFLLKQNDILIGMDGSKVGYNFSIVYDFELPILLVQRVARLRSKFDYYNEFIWQLIKNGTFTNYILSIYTGTAVPHISKEQILDFSVISPPEITLRKFSSFADPIREIISKNIYQIQLLTNIRDTLLPKLMSGEIRV